MKTTASFYADIHIGGDMQTIRQICREFCLQGLCVRITPCDFIFTGGSETGATVSLLRYRRFPSSTESLEQKAIELAEKLLVGCCQRSCTVQTPVNSHYLENSNITIPR